MTRRPSLTFLAWAMSPLLHTGAWFVWQSVLETMAPAAPEWLRRPDWYSFILVCSLLTLAAHAINTVLRKL